MISQNLAPVPSTRDIAERGESIYQRRYQSEFEKNFLEKFVAINVRTEEVTIAETSEDAVHQALQKDPEGLFHLIRVGHPAAFDAGWYMSCAS